MANERICNREGLNGCAAENRGWIINGAWSCINHWSLTPIEYAAAAPVESAWLLERNLTPEGQEYLTVDAGCFGWTTDSLKALRLARREDADKLAEIVDDCQHVREHQWG